MGGEDATEGRSGQVEVRLVLKFECKLLDLFFWSTTGKLFSLQRVRARF